MNNIFISLGAQCTTSTLFDILYIKKETFPFDWMISTPEFVYIILKLLLIDNMEIEDIVNEHFFFCDKNALRDKIEEGHYIINEDFEDDNDNNILFNSKYNVCFPHDCLKDKEKYIRRLIRLKHLILDKNNYISFVYVSVASQNYLVNGQEVIKDLYNYIEKINNLIKNVRDNYKIIIFDTKNQRFENYDKRISYNKIEDKNSWIDLLPELIEKMKENLYFS
jgi:hypothetical protein